MSDTKELIERLRKLQAIANSADGDTALDDTSYGDAADALTELHAEVERLRGEVSELEEALDEYQALHDANIVRFDALSARAKRAEADRDRFHDTIEVLDARVARLTGQLQAVQEASDWAKEHGSDSVDAYQLDAILDAAADGGK